MDDKDFRTRLKIAKKQFLNKDKTQDDDKNRGLFMGSAFRLGTELVAAAVVGTIIGFILDNWFDTKPWFIIIFFLIGVIAGILNVIKVAKSMQEKN